MPESLITVVTRRLSGLSGQARQILPVAAVLGPSFTVAELAAVLGVPALDFLGVIQEAAAAGGDVPDRHRAVLTGWRSGTR